MSIYEIKPLFTWTDSFISIDNIYGIKALLHGGAISIEAQINIDEMLSIAITNSEFISHNSGCIHRLFSFA